MHILVTGSSGTIGTRLCERLLSEGHEVTGIDRVENKWISAVQDRTHVIDLLEPAKLADVSGEFDALVHLAANARVYELVENPTGALENMTTLFHALEFARTRGIPRFLFASSRECYGDVIADIYSEEMVHIEECESPYTASKMGGEAFVESYSRCYDLDHLTFRFSNVYGAYDDSIRVVPQFFRLAKAGETLTVFGAEKFLDFTYIDDAVQGIMLALQNFDAAKNRTYNIATGTGNSIRRLAELMIELTGSSSDIDMGQKRVGEINRYVADISRAQEALGYEPQTSFEEGVAKAVEWYSKNG